MIMMKQRIVGEMVYHLVVHTTISTYIGLFEQPWTVYLDTAPEDQNTSLPCSFPDYLSFMEMDYKESLNAYLDGLVRVTCALGFCLENQNYGVVEDEGRQGIRSTELGRHQGQTPSH